MKRFIYISLALVFTIACKKSSDEIQEPQIFENVDSGQSGLDFINKIEETETANYFKYMYMYIGGGVAAADFDKDGLEDLFLVSNSHESKLYKNLGDLKFEDITTNAGIFKKPGFDVGAAVADVNNDGWLDIYITRGGWEDSNGGFANMLFINNGISTLPNGKKGITFSEKAQEYGLADENRGIAATFFDYDHDGDIDLYLSNTPDFEDKGNVILDLDKVSTDPNTVLLKGSDKLYKNTGNKHFEDVSIQAGIKPDIGFGLSPQVGDLNNDGWMDIYVCNDFRIPDFVYINNKNGTFSEQRNQSLKHMSFNSMGSDIADINNDGFMDIFTLDMNPQDYVRARTTMGMTSQYQFELMNSKNYHYQYMHNMLQLNNGNGTFSEIANMAGVANTDWSWACLMADFDLDGYNDIYVTNGVFRDVIDRDVNDEILKTLQARGRKPSDADFLEFVKKLPQQKLQNYFYKNNKDLTFKDATSEWAETQPTFSNGATYADLDNDGDLDLVVSNLNDKISLLKNTSIEQKLGNYLKFDIQGSEKNTFGIGSTVKLYLKNGEVLTRQLLTTRGFLSAVSRTLHFGLLPNTEITKAEIIWPNGKLQNISIPKANTTTTLKYTEENLTDYVLEANLSSKVFIEQPISIVHQDPIFDDFKIQTLLPQKYSQLGPALSTSDINSDGIIDFYIGGGKGQAGQIFLGKSNGEFVGSPQLAFDLDKNMDDTDAIFFDVDQDKDLDLLVLSGSSEFEGSQNALAHRLYINNGKGLFERENVILPIVNSVGSVVKVADFDKDGDLDIFIGSRMVPGYYPFAPKHAIIVNNNGFYEELTDVYAPQLAKFGMITDAVFDDIDQDNDLDLIVCGEWTGIEIFENNGKQLLLTDKYPTLSNATGWWNKILVQDIDGDGDKDIVAGNRGLNSKDKGSIKFPLTIYGNDFDNNGVVDPIMTTWYNEKEVPVRSRVAFTQQMPLIGNRITTFKGFALKTIQEILAESLKDALKLQAVEFSSGIFLNEGKSYVFKAFAPQVQTSMINSMLYEDFDNDGHKDLLMAGNNYVCENETTRLDAGNGYFLKGNGKGDFKYVPNYLHQFWAQGDVRKMVLTSSKNILVANNSAGMQKYSFK